MARDLDLIQRYEELRSRLTRVVRKRMHYNAAAATNLEALALLTGELERVTEGALAGERVGLVALVPADVALGPLLGQRHGPAMQLSERVEAAPAPEGDRAPEPVAQAAKASRGPVKRKAKKGERRTAPRNPPGRKPKVAEAAPEPEVAPETV